MKEWLLCMVVVAPLLLGSGLAQSQGPSASPPRPPLVACEAGTTAPCVVAATATADMSGIWKQYQSNPMFAPVGGMGFIRYSADGTFALADTLDHVALPGYGHFPHGTYRFDGRRMTITVANPPPGMPECARSVQEVRVVQLAGQKVAMTFIPVEDACKPRLSDTGQVQLYIGPAR